MGVLSTQLGNGTPFRGKVTRSKHQTQWTAQFAVASELCKRGYQVALTLGNHPTIDLMVVSPAGRKFVVDVKGLYQRNMWQVTPKPMCDDLIYIFALVPDPSRGPNQFFILTQKEVSDGIKDAVARWVARNPARAGLVDTRPGVLPGFASQHEDRWDKLPS